MTMFSLMKGYALRILQKEGKTLIARVEIPNMHDWLVLNLTSLHQGNLKCPEASTSICIAGQY